jgi:hypothetical protein
MFSRAELEFLKGETEVSPAYERVLVHRIQKKTKNLNSVLQVFAQNEKTRRLLSDLHVITGNSNKAWAVTDSSNGKKALIERLSQNEVAGPVGFEPTAYSLGGCRAIQSSPSRDFHAEVCATGPAL